MSSASPKTPRLPPRIPPRAKAEKYFARIARHDRLPSQNAKLLGIGGWVSAGRQ